jgi:hypothetical protein
MRECEGVPFRDAGGGSRKSSTEVLGLAQWCARHDVNVAQRRVSLLRQLRADRKVGYLVQRTSGACIKTLFRSQHVCRIDPYDTQHRHQR